MVLEDARGCLAGSEPVELLQAEPVKTTMDHALEKIFHNQIHVYDTR